MEKKTFSEITEELEKNGIYILKHRTTSDGRQLYKVQNKAYNPYHIWTAADIRMRYEMGEFI